jgi:sigma-B regulation protein RsbQ
LSKELEYSLNSIDQRIARKFAEITFFSDNRNELSRVKSPTLVLQCAHDMIAPEAVVNYIQENLLKGTLKKLKAKGHCPHMTHPQETVEAIKNYLGVLYC